MLIESHFILLFQIGRLVELIRLTMGLLTMTTQHPVTKVTLPVTRETGLVTKELHLTTGLTSPRDVDHRSLPPLPWASLLQTPRNTNVFTIYTYPLRTNVVSCTTRTEIVMLGRRLRYNVPRKPWKSSRSQNRTRSPS